MFWKSESPRREKIFGHSSEFSREKWEKCRPLPLPTVSVRLLFDELKWNGFSYGLKSIGEFFFYLHIKLFYWEFFDWHFFWSHHNDFTYLFMCAFICLFTAEKVKGLKLYKLFVSLLFSKLKWDCFSYELGSNQIVLLCI